MLSKPKRKWHRPPVVRCLRETPVIQELGKNKRPIYFISVCLSPLQPPQPRQRPAWGAAYHWAHIL